MDVALLCLAIVAVGAYVAAPLYRGDDRGDRTWPVPAAPRPAPSEGRARRLDGLLEDLEVDRASGLIDEPTYERERAALQAPDTQND